MRPTVPYGMNRIAPAKNHTQGGPISGTLQTQFEHIGGVSCLTLTAGNEVGTSLAGLVFAVMLLTSGQSATITGTLAGQVVMEGFLQLRMKLWVRRLITRGMALIPTLFIIIWFGEKSTIWLLVGSQVFLSFQLPFVMVSLLLLTSNKDRMGFLVNSKLTRTLGWGCAGLIIVANFLLIISIISF